MPVLIKRLFWTHLCYLLRGVFSFICYLLRLRRSCKYSCLKSLSSELLDSVISSFRISILKNRAVTVVWVWMCRHMPWGGCGDKEQLCSICSLFLECQGSNFGVRLLGQMTTQQLFSLLTPLSSWLTVKKPIYYFSCKSVWITETSIRH